MSSATSPRLALLRELRDEILVHYGSGRPLVAVDGVDAARASSVADDLAATWTELGRTAVRVDIADFAVDGRIDVDAFRSSLVTPFRAREPFSVALTGAAHDGDARDGDAVLIVSGPFLLGADLIGFWNTSVYAEAPREASPAAEGSDAPEALAAAAVRRYLAEVRPRTRANAIVDVTDPERPVRRFADSC